jgi:N-formylmaleamate deformylase
MAEWQSGDIEANGIRLHYIRTGDGSKPPVVLAHGFSDDGLCWTPVAAALESDYDVVMVDARGHGKSEGPETGYSIAANAADLHGVIVGLGLKRPAILGHSMGGATALALAGTYPDVPGAILVEDPGGLNFNPAPRDPEEDAKRSAGRFGWIIALKRKTREELLADQRAAKPHWSEAELGPWADSKLRLSFNVLNHRGGPPADWPALLPEIQCPSLLITADPARGAIVSPETAKQVEGMIPRLQIAHIPEAGHSIRRDQFDHYMSAVRDFLSRSYRSSRAIDS